MARIGGVDLPRNKRLEVALTYIFGIGKTSARKIMEIGQFDSAVRTDDLSDEQIASLRSIIDDNFKTEGDLIERPTSLRKSPSTLN